MSNHLNAHPAAPVAPPSFQSVLRLVGAWSAALNGKRPLPAVLDDLRVLTGAACVTLCRWDHAQPAARVAAHALRVGQTGLPDRPAVHLPAHLRRRHPASAVAGSVWFLSEQLHDPAFATTEAFRAWARCPSVSDMALIFLDAPDNKSDFIEIVFAPSTATAGNASSAEPVPQALLAALAGALAEGWALRHPGLIAQQIIANNRRNRPATSPPPAASILDFANPSSLSRAEFRVCMLLSQGLKARAIADELGLSEATVRSHLKNIYAKTETAGQFDLLYRIKADQAPHAARGPHLSSAA